MLTKAGDYFHCETTDKFILFNDLTHMDERIDHELDFFDSKKKFLANVDETFADYFINKAAALLKKKGYFRYRGRQVQIDDLREKIKDYQFWRAFMQTLQFSAFVFSAGNIPEMAQISAKTIKGGGQGGDNSGKVRQQKSESKKKAWQAEADKIWMKPKHSKWSNLRVAKIILNLDEFKDGNVDTIRKSIKNPLL